MNLKSILGKLIKAHWGKVVIMAMAYFFVVSPIVEHGINGLIFIGCALVVIILIVMAFVWAITKL